MNSNKGTALLSTLDLSYASHIIAYPTGSHGNDLHPLMLLLVPLTLSDIPMGLLIFDAFIQYASWTQIANLWTIAVADGCGWMDSRSPSN